MFPNTNNCGQNDGYIKKVFNESYNKIQAVYDYLFGSGTLTVLDHVTSIKTLLAAIPRDGISNALPSFQALFNYLNANKIPFTSNMLYGNFKFIGTGNITIQVSADFSGIVFEAESWTGEFVLSSYNNTITYLAGDGGIGDEVINAMVANSEDLYQGSKIITGWQNRTECDDAYIKIITDQIAYQYRTTYPLLTSYNHCWNKGVLNSPFLYDFSQYNITTIEVKKFDELPMKITNLYIKVGNNLTETSFVRVKRSQCFLEVKFDISKVFSKNQMQLVYFFDCAYVEAHMTFTNTMQGNFNENEPIESEKGTPVAYCFGANKCYNLRIKAQGDGDGWGMNASNETARIEILPGSNLSRIDTHSAFYEYIKVNRTTLGEYGLTITGCGNVIINDCELQTDRQSFYNSASTLVTSRGDTGGWIDGDLIINNLKITSNEESIDLLVNQQGDTLDSFPAGSPINPRFFKNININNIYTDISDKTNAKTISINPTKVHKNENIRVDPCESLTIRDCKDIKLLVQYDFNDVLPGSSEQISGNYNCEVTIENCHLFGFTMNEISNNFKAKVNFLNVIPFSENEMEFYADVSGDYNLINTQHNALYFSSYEYISDETVFATTNHRLYFTNPGIDLNNYFLVNDNVSVTGTFNKDLTILEPPTALIGDILIPVSGIYRVLEVGTNYLTLDVLNDGIPANWEAIQTVYPSNVLDGTTDVYYTPTQGGTSPDGGFRIELCPRAEKHINVNLINPVFIHKYPDPELLALDIQRYGDFFPHKLDNVFITVLGGRLESPEIVRLEHATIRNKIKFIGTEFYDTTNLTNIIPIQNNKNVIDARFFDEKQVTFSAQTPIQFFEEDLWYDLNCSVEFEPLKTQYVTVEGEFVAALDTYGSVQARVVMEYRNDPADSWIQDSVTPLGIESFIPPVSSDEIMFTESIRVVLDGGISYLESESYDFTTNENLSVGMTLKIQDNIDSVDYNGIYVITSINSSRIGFVNTSSNPNWANIPTAYTPNNYSGYSTIPVYEYNIKYNWARNATTKKIEINRVRGRYWRGRLELMCFDMLKNQTYPIFASIALSQSPNTTERFVEKITVTYV